MAKECKPGKHKFRLLFWTYKRKTLASKGEAHYGRWDTYVCKRCKYTTLEAIPSYKEGR
jgi:hypothetical protein